MVIPARFMASEIANPTSLRLSNLFVHSKADEEAYPAFSAQSF
jgi:hypothetical protein